MTTIIERLSRIERVPSRAAKWCEDLAAFCVPYIALTILGHRFGLVDLQSTLWLLALGIALLVASILLGIRGLIDLWTSGRKGGVRAARGIALAALLLTPFAYFGFKAFALPPLYDISTDLIDPPLYDNALDDREAGMNDVVAPDEETRAMQLQAYPRVTARRYPLGAGRVFRAVAELVQERDWTILTADVEEGNAPIDEEGSAIVTSTPGVGGLPNPLPVPDFRPDITRSERDAFVAPQRVSPTGREESELVGGESADERYIEALASTAIFGFPSDVVLRIVEEENGTLVDMRSNSRWGPHDLGSNAARIVEFMNDLDTALQGLNDGT